VKLSQFQHKLLLIGLTTVNCGLWQVVVAIAESNPLPTAPSQNDRIDSSRTPKPQTELTQQLSPPVVPAPIKVGVPPLSVGLILNEKSVLEGINVRGYEDGEKAIDFERWLLPFDEVMKALGIKIKEIGKGETVELSSSSFRVNFDTHKLQDDPVLGRSISIANLQSIGGIKAKFDLYKYAIVITILDRSSTAASVSSDTPIELDGLPIISTGKIGIGAIQQRSNVSGGSSDTTRTSGEFRAVGNIGTGSWQIRIDQSTLEGINDWNLTSATALFQGKTTDWAIGSQQPFWGQSFSGSGSYWGITTIARTGFIPPVTTTSSDFSVSDRLQSSRVGRSIIGTASPGTVVQLVRNLNTEVIKEVLVDSSGTYRFENIIVGSVGDDVLGRDYRLLLYPRGQLTASPEIRDVQFTTLLGQLPSGASAWVASVGGNRVTSGQFGKFDAVQGGVLYRRGVNESLTVGVGSIYDAGAKGVGEVLFQPTGVPLEVAGSIVTDTYPVVLGRLSYQPSTQFSLTANVDKLSVRSDVNWRLSPGFAALASYDSQTGTKVGGEFTARHQRNATSIRATIDDRTRLSWNARQTLDRLQFGYQKNDVSSLAEISYRIPIGREENGEHQLSAAYQTNTSGTTTTFGSLSWKYRSPARNSVGSYLWQSELGYGLGLFGGGILVGLDYSIAPGWQFRGRYRGATESTSGNDFSIELTTTLQTQGGITGTDRSIEDLATFGQVKIFPFFDRNGNGRQDANEEGYFDPLLLEINRKSLKSLYAQTNGLVSTLQLSPGSYRLDLNPAGYPINYRSKSTALRIDVVAGTNIEIPVPLIPAYAVTGIIKNSTGEPIVGGRVEAVAIANGEKYTSVTNDSGIYYLEGLEQGEYRINVSGLAPKDVSCKSSCDDRIRITPQTNPVMELNLVLPQQLIPTKSTTSFRHSLDRQLFAFIDVAINY
jgi:Carboxypeptidase regulatory-like domain